MMLVRLLKNEMRIPKIYLYFFLILAYFSTSLYYSIDKAGSFEEIVRLISIVGICPLVYEVTRNERDLKRFLKFYGLSVIVPMLVGFTQILFFRDEITYYGYPRVIGTFNHPSAFGDYIVLFCIFFLGFFFYFVEKKKFKTKRKITLILLLLGALLFLTFTRGSWLGFVLVTLLMTFVKNKRFFFKYLITLSIILLVLSPFIIQRLLGEVGNTGVQVVDIGGNLEVTGSYASRLTFTLYAINNMFLDSPITGKGLGSFFYHYAPLNFHIQVETHNDLAKILGETGIIGGILYLGIFFYLIKASYKLYKRKSDPLSKTIYLIAFTMSVFMLYSGLTNASLRLLPVQFYFWTFIGIAFSLTKGSILSDSSVKETIEDSNAGDTKLKVSYRI